MSIKQTLLNKIDNREIIVGVVGLGYVGLPLLVEKPKPAIKPSALTSSPTVELVNQGINYIGDVVDEELSVLVANGMLSATCDFAFVKDADFIAIAVLPWTRTNSPISPIARQCH